MKPSHESVPQCKGVSAAETTHDTEAKRSFVEASAALIKTLQETDPTRAISGAIYTFSAYGDWLRAAAQTDREAAAHLQRAGESLAFSLFFHGHRKELRDLALYAIGLATDLPAPDLVTTATSTQTAAELRSPAPLGQFPESATRDGV